MWSTAAATQVNVQAAHTSQLYEAKKIKAQRRDHTRQSTGSQRKPRRGSVATENAEGLAIT
jgi:hypothetical protein